MVLPIASILVPGSDVDKDALLEYLEAQETGAGLASATPVDADTIKFGDVSDSGDAKGTTLGGIFTLLLGAARTFVGLLKVTIGVMVAQDLADGATINWNMNLGQVAKVVLGGNRTIAAPTNLRGSSTEAAFYSLAVVQDGTGSRTLTWNSVFKFTNLTAPTLTTTAGARDEFQFKSDGTNLYEIGRSQKVG